MPSSHVNNCWSTHSLVLSTKSSHNERLCVGVRSMTGEAPLESEQKEKQCRFIKLALCHSCNQGGEKRSGREQGREREGRRDREGGRGEGGEKG